MTGKAFRYGYLLIVLWLISGCGIPERPKVITVSKSPVFRPSNPREVKTPEQAMVAIVTVCRDDLSLPVVDPLYLYLYKNTASFALYGHGWGTLPIDVSNEAAFAQENRIHINLEKTFKGSWGTLVRLLAHEYTHNIHYVIAGKELRVPSWITEGFADWAAARVLHSLGWEDYAISLYRTRQELIRHRDVLPGISSLSYDRDWESYLSKPKGLIRTHGLAFVAVDRLIQLKGLSAMIQYLRSVEFRDSFGLSVEEFTVSLEEYLSETKRPKPGAFTIARPDWRIGYHWDYTEKRPGSSATVVDEIIREDNFQGTPSFVVREGDRENFHAKDSLALLATMKDKKLTSELDRSDQFLSWPLESGKEWRNSFTQRNLEQKSSRKFDRVMFVAGIEEVKVPAGTFEAIKIEAYGFNGGRLLAEYWYSPKAKWLVKVRNYTQDEGLIEKELFTFKVD